MAKKFRCLEKRTNSKTQADVDQLKQTGLFKIIFFFTIIFLFYFITIIFKFLTSASSGTHVRIVRTGSYTPENQEQRITN